MKIIRFLLYAVGVLFCIVGFLGHSEAFSGAALSFFAVIITTIKQKRESEGENCD